MTTDISALGESKLKNVITGETILLKSLWGEQDTAIIFFRRWGCLLCRLWAKEIGEIAPVLKKNNIRLVGVGVEELGWKEFVDGKFFDGEHYIVESRATYKALGFKRFSVLSVLAALMWKESRNAISKARGMGLEGNMKGDGLQNGGALFVRRGGELLRHFVQDGPAEHLSNEEILKLFNLEGEYKPKDKPATETVCKWLFEPTPSFSEIKAAAARSVVNSWSDRACRRLAVMSQQKLVTHQEEKKPLPSKLSGASTHHIL